MNPPADLPIDDEVPVPDAQEQRTALAAEPAEGDTEETAEHPVAPTTEANDADVIEQSQPVTEDEDYPHGEAEE
jgi:hypothetical protein